MPIGVVFIHPLRYPGRKPEGGRVSANDGQAMLVPDQIPRA